MSSSASNPAYVGITLSVQDTDVNTQSGVVAGTSPIIFTDGADLRANTL
jgi:hypothetical protein